MYTHSPWRALQPLLGRIHMKVCPRCNISKHETKYAKDSTRPKGLDAVCKQCRADYRANNKTIERARRTRNNNTEDGKLHRTVRQITARKWGKASKFNCAVCSCAKKAEEFHHMDYKKPDMVLPLCKKHHKKIHTGDK